MLEVVIPTIATAVISMITALSAAVIKIVKEINKPKQQITDLSVKIDILNGRVKRLENEHFFNTKPQKKPVIMSATELSEIKENN